MLFNKEWKKGKKLSQTFSKSRLPYFAIFKTDGSLVLQGSAVHHIFLYITSYERVPRTEELLEEKRTHHRGGVDTIVGKRREIFCLSGLVADNITHQEGNGVSFQVFRC